MEGSQIRDFNMSDHPKYRIHILGCAHIPTRYEYSSCAFTSKVLKLCKMMKALGHHVTFYGVESSEAECDEFVQVSSLEVLKRTYGEYDWKNSFYKQFWADEAHRVFNNNCIDEINKRKQDGDFLFLTMGVDNQIVYEAVKMPLTIEPGVGYYGICTKHKVFESYAWMHYLYGRSGVGNEGNFFDCVIPNFFDPKDFEFREKKEDYYLYLGRIIRKKGVELARQVCKEIGAKLVIAGQRGDEEVDISGAEFFGHADIEQRKELLAGAKAVFVPTQYIEPFGGVAVEAMMSGTPVITTDWGAFTETNIDGVTGYHVRTFGEAVWAAQHAGDLDPKKIRQWAVENYSMERVKWLYQAYLEQVYAVFEHGEAAWYVKSDRGLSKYERYTKFYADSH